MSLRTWNLHIIRTRGIMAADRWPRLAGTGVLLALSGVLLAGLSACGGGPPLNTVAPLPAQARVYQTDRLGIGDSLRVVIRDPIAWNEAWANATSGDPSPPAMPEINFDRDMALLVAAGRMDPGDRIQVDSVGVRDEDLMVIVRITEDCRQFTSDVYPLEIVRVARSDRPVRWVERRELAPHCRGGR